MKHEQKFGLLFRSWIKANPMPSAAFELKQTPTDSWLFSGIREHQIEALQAAKDEALLYKIPDDSAGVKPFDMVYMRNTAAFVVIKYPGEFHLIDIDVFVTERESGRKSITKVRANQIAFISVPIPKKALE